MPVGAAVLYGALSSGDGSSDPLSGLRVTRSPPRQRLVDHRQGGLSNGIGLNPIHSYGVKYLSTVS